MIALALLLASTPVYAVEQAPPMPPEIVVVGQRLDRARVDVTRDSRGNLHCSISVSSGDAKLDDRLCRASARCVRKVGDKGRSAIRRYIVEGKSKLLARFVEEWRRSRGL